MDQLFWNISIEAYRRCIEIVNAFSELPLNGKEAEMIAVFREGTDGEFTFVFGEYDPQKTPRMELSNPVLLPWKEVLRLVPEIRCSPTREWLAKLLRAIHQQREPHLVKGVQSR